MGNDTNLDDPWIILNSNPGIIIADTDNLISDEMVIVDHDQHSIYQYSTVE